MRCPSPIAGETERLLALTEYGFDQEQVLPALDPVVQIASRMFEMPIAAVNIVGSDHVFFASSVGIRECDMRRDVSFCAHAITQDDVMVVLDATLDSRFHDNPLVTDGAGIRFYAGVPLRAPSGHALGALCVIDSRPRSSFSEQDRARLQDLARLASDKLELHRLENATQSSQFSFADIAGNSPNAIVCFNHDHIITLWNAKAAALFGSSALDMIGQPLSAIFPTSENHALPQMISNMIASGVQSISGSAQETLGLRRDGSTIALEVSPFCWEEGDTPNFGVILADVSEQRQREDALLRLTNFDSLTGLANRDLFYRRVKEDLELGEVATVLAIDLDHFKDVNDTLGYDVGDSVLATVSQRILSCVRPEDTVARIGSDEFAILLSRVSDPTRVSVMTKMLTEAIAGPIVANGHEIRMASSCGIATSPMHGQTAEELIGNADLALYQAKSNESGHPFVFIPALRQEAAERRTWKTELHRAVENHEFELFYQPQVRLMDGAIVGAEALIRWNHPDRGYLSPGAFLPILEKGSLAATVGTWVLETACAQAAAWRIAGATNLRMGVNLFSAQFLAKDLDTKVKNAIENCHLQPDALELEITENIALNQDDLILKPLQELHDIGICIAFDDFGTGYASLSLLKNYPLTCIKIDQSFIRNMCASRTDLATVRAAVDLARNYELEVIAEGIELEEQSVVLKQLGCEEGQGYLFGKPMPAHQFSRILLNAA